MVSNATSASFSLQNTQTLDEARQSAESISDFSWSFWPRCHSNKSSPGLLCTFSDEKFAGGRGIFIVTSPDRAQEILKKTAFTQNAALNQINDQKNPPFVQQEFPGKGRGLIANKTIHRGDQIFAASALLIRNRDVYLLEEKYRLGIVQWGVETLPEKSKTLFWSLLDHFKGDPVDQRISTNAFQVYVNGAMYDAVIPEIAMLNHDCRPNAAYFWDEETLSHYVHATQTIHPGEEITITYIYNEKSRLERMDHLKAIWGFGCSCSTCSAHPFMADRSDERLQQISDLTSKINDWSPQSEATPEMAETLITLYQQERLFASLGVPYKYAAEAYASYGDRHNTIRYAGLSAEYTTLDKGFRDSDAEEMRAMAKNPELSWSWKKRMSPKGVRCTHSH
ncbi:hypothetical protein OPT61_g2248 [Boeremia exigua]|uniref:Uncharacterized protein n=1 Tax=Boeremia exigua TaxID=749465 RepID=A0ACC2IM63_9PLEO|nr:hypothetical protein OPT61_g2248 [Boeremia exigua]